MVAMPQPSHLSEADYLAIEQSSETKHEFANGDIRAMSGATRRHNLITSRITGLLDRTLLERPCDYYQSDMRVHVQAAHAYYYPDIVALCGDPDFLPDVFDTLTNPQVIMEVLSPSTEKIDRGEKFLNYKTIPSLEAYLLIAQDTLRVEMFSRHDGGWLHQSWEAPGDTVALPGLDCTLSLSDIYAKVSFDTPSESKTGPEDA